MKPYPYQEEGIKQISRFGGRVLLADEMGLGKSLQASVWVKRNRKEAAPAIIVCPASLKFNWQHEVLIHTGTSRVEVLEGRTGHNRRMLKPPHFTIVNYDILEAWLPHLLKLGAKTLIIDECQYIKNRSRKRSKAVRKLAKEMKYIIALSGTPLTNRPEELWNTLNILRPDLFPSFYQFGYRYCGPKVTPWGTQFKGATRIPELHRILSSNLMIRRRKKDVLKQLPPKTRQIIPMPLTNRKDYDEAKTNFIQWLLKTKPEKVSAARRAKAIVQLGYLKRLAAEGRLSSVQEWIDLFLQQTERKLIVFAQHKKILEALYEKHKHQAVLVSGDVTARRRHLAVEAFQKQPNVRLFIGQIKAAGVGLNLTAASDVCFAELAWTPGDHTQVEDRSHRIGQTEKTTCYYLIAHDTIEERICQINQEKQNVLDNVLDGGNGESLNIYDLLIKELENNAR